MVSQYYIYLSCLYPILFSYILSSLKQIAIYLSEMTFFQDFSTKIILSNIGKYVGRGFLAKLKSTQLFQKSPPIITVISTLVCSSTQQVIDIKNSVKQTTNRCLLFIALLLNLKFNVLQMLQGTNITLSRIFYIHQKCHPFSFRAYFRNKIWCL